MKRRLRFLCSAALLLLGANLCFAEQQQPPQPEKGAEKPKEEKKPAVPEEKIVQSKHSPKIGGQGIENPPTQIIKNSTSARPAKRNASSSAVFCSRAACLA